MSEQHTFVGPDAAGKKLDELLARPGMADEVDEILAEMDEGDRIYTSSLATIRRAADQTQVALANRMGVAQSEISRIEKRHDMLLSTLGSYLAAAGVSTRVLVTVNGHDIELDLAALAQD
jgi:DNA-binding XRE family transcriptional regulator